MSILKKKKKERMIAAQELIERLPPPRVIRESRIKPTTCETCHTVYQAGKYNLIQELDIASPYAFGRVSRAINYTKCPICDNPNLVEFEEVS